MRVEAKRGDPFAVRVSPVVLLEIKQRPSATEGRAKGLWMARFPQVVSPLCL